MKCLGPLCMVECHFSMQTAFNSQVGSLVLHSTFSPSGLFLGGTPSWPEKAKASQIWGCWKEEERVPKAQSGPEGAPPHTHGILLG